jgi:riboflavin synthase
MFTGLIADLGSVVDLERDDDGATLAIHTGLAGELAEGDSIAVNGVCLTAIQTDGEGFKAQAMEETLRRSSLGALHVGAKVNLELALRADGRLGGHIVQGHVDGTGTIAEIRPDGFARVLRIEIDPASEGGAGNGSASEADAGNGNSGAGSGVLGSLERYLVEKGSVAVDGVSLTVSALHEGGFSVSLIPETLQRTTLGGGQVGDRVNLEADILAKHVERLMEARA